QFLMGGSRAKEQAVLMEERRIKVVEDFASNVSKDETMKRLKVSSKAYNIYTRELREERNELTKKKAIALREEGMLVKDIAERLGIHRTTISIYTKEIKNKTKLEKVLA